MPLLAAGIALMLDDNLRNERDLDRLAVLIELLREMEKNKGARGGGRKDAPRGHLTEPRDSSPKLSDFGINKSQSSKWQRLAATQTDPSSRSFRCSSNMCLSFCFPGSVN